LIIIVSINNLPLENSFIISAGGNEIRIVIGESYIRYMRRMSLEFVVTLIFEIGEFEELDKSEIISCCYDLTLLIPIGGIDVSSIRTRWENSLDWPTQNCSPRCPFFISI
jgi:hypothetical protein